MKLNLWIVLFLCSGSFLNAMEQQEETIPFQTMNGKTFLVKKGVAKNFCAIRSLFEDDKDIFQSLKNQSSEPIPLSEVTPRAFGEIIDFYENDHVPGMNCFNSLHQETLIEIINAAYYLNCKSVLQVACSAYAKKYVKNVGNGEWGERHKNLLVDVDRMVANIILNKYTAFDDFFKSTRNLSLKESLLAFPRRKFVVKSVNAESITPLAISSKGSYLSVAVEGKHSQLFDLKNNVLQKPLKKNSLNNAERMYGNFSPSFRQVRSDFNLAAFSPDESLYCQVYPYETLRQKSPQRCLIVWRTTDDEVLMEQEGDFMLPGFSPDNKILAAIEQSNDAEDENAEIFIWNLKKLQKQPIKKLPTISNYRVKQNYAFSTQGELAYLKDKTTLALWDPKTNQETEVPCYGKNCKRKNYHIYSFHFSPDGSKLVFLAADRELNYGPQKQYSIDPNAVIQVYDLKKQTHNYYPFKNERPFDLDFSDDGKYFVVSIHNYDSPVMKYIFDLDFFLDFFGDHPYLVHSVLWPKGKYALKNYNGLLHYLEWGERKIVRGKEKISDTRGPHFDVREFMFLEGVPSYHSSRSSIQLIDRNFLVLKKACKGTITIWGPFFDSFQLKEDLEKLSSLQVAFMKTLWKRKKPLSIKRNKLPSGKTIPFDSPLWRIYKSLPYAVRQRLYGKVIEKDVKAILVRGTSSETYAVSGLKNHLIE